MFSSTPFKKAKEGAKPVVGSFVEVDAHGSEANENQNPGNSNIIANHPSKADWKDSTPVRKSGKRSVSKLFSSSKKSTVSRTPGRKLFKKLICTPGKARSLPDTSLSEVDDFGIAIPRNHSDLSRLGMYPSFSSDGTSAGANSSPPKLERKSIASHSFDSTNTHQNRSPTMNHQRAVDDALVAASNHSGRSEHTIFLANSFSSDEYERRKEIKSDTTSQLPLHYSSPQAQNHASPSAGSRDVMRSPGLTIPTPAIAKLHQTNASSYSTDFQFSQRLGTVPDSPMEDVNANPKNLSSRFEENNNDDDDDDAFLPDDFNGGKSAPNHDGPMFTSTEVDQKISDARREERLQMRRQHDKVLREKLQEYEQMLIESGRQWKKDSDDQEAKFKKILTNEKHRVSQKHHELINKTQSLESVQAALKKMEEDRDALKMRIDELVAKDENLALETETNNAQLSEKLRAVTALSEEAQTQLAEAMNEISLLKEQLAETPSVDPNEIRSSKLEVENLRNLRAEDAKEIEALQTQLSTIVQEHQDMCTPKKKNATNGDDNDESPPCVEEIDMLRVDYNRAQDQLKSMGKILKRYKSERDDYREKLQEQEQRHVQAIAVAVKQVTEDQKATMELLTKENEDLRAQSKTVGEKTTKEMNLRMDDLKKRYETELADLRAKSKDAKERAATQHKNAEMEKRKLIDTYDKKIELITRYNDELRKTKEKENEILRSDLDRLKTTYANERESIVNSKSEEFERLEEQMKSMNDMHNEELELVTSEAREESAMLRQKIEELQKELNARPVDAIPEEAVKAMRAKFEESLQEIKGKAKTDKDNLLAEVESLKEQTTRVNQLEAQIENIKKEHEVVMKKERNEYDRQLIVLKTKHGSESDELLEQLDQIEAEAHQRCMTAELAVREKDAVITALGSQLAESEANTGKIRKQFDALKGEVESLRNNLEATNASNQARQTEVADLVARHKREMEEQTALREAACHEAREETIALAEAQLAERQEYYQALKRELDNAQSKISVLERDLRFTKKEAEELDRRYEAREADLRDELAQSKAAVVKMEAKIVRLEKVHHGDLDRVRDAEKAMKAKLDEAQATNRSLQKTLTATMKEKQRVDKELAEVTAISEEFATMLEKAKH